MHSSEEEEDDLHSDLEGEEDGAEGEEEEAGEEGEEKKKVDDDEDRSNPQYIPKKGTFYEHDDRTAENPWVIDNFFFTWKGFVFKIANGPFNLI